MNKTILTIALATALVASAHAQSISDLTVSGAFDYESQYVFRGKKITNSAFQPSVNFAYPVVGGSLNAYVWTSQPIGRRGATTPGPNQSNEIDLGVYYTHTLADIGLKDATIDVGYQYYWYPEASGNAFAPPPPFPVSPIGRTHEIHAGLQWDTTSLLGGYNINPQVYVYHDFVLDGNTIQFSLSYTWDLSDVVGVKNLSLVPSGNMGWNQQHRSFGDQLTAGIPNWNNSYWYWTLSLELDYKLNSFATLFVGARYAGNSDGTTNGLGGSKGVASNPQLGGTPNSVWAGLGVKFGM